MKLKVLSVTTATMMGGSLVANQFIPRHNVPLPGFALSLSGSASDCSNDLVGISRDFRLIGLPVRWKFYERNHIGSSKLWLSPSQQCRLQLLLCASSYASILKDYPHSGASYSDQTSCAVIVYDANAGEKSWLALGCEQRLSIDSHGNISDSSNIIANAADVSEGLMSELQLKWVLKDSN